MSSSYNVHYALEASGLCLVFLAFFLYFLLLGVILVVASNEGGLMV